MSDCSPLKLAQNGHSSPSQSIDSQNSGQYHEANLGPRHQHIGGDINHQADATNHSRVRSQSESSSKSGQLRYGARNVIELFIPVTICMLIVVGLMKATNSYRYSSQTAIWYAQMMFTDQTVDTGTRVWQSFANALVMLVMIVIMTTVLILLYKFRCYATIHGWLIISSLMLLFIFTTVHIAEILRVYNIPMDIYTLGIFLWNFGVVGMICIHWKGPLLLQQGYLITISAFMALIFIQSLPDWTIWTVLAIVSVWDLVAVLAPRGPLRILVETAQERNESIFPALIYSSTMLWEVASGVAISPISSISMADTENTGAKSKRRIKEGQRSKSRSQNQPSSGGSSSGSRANHANSTVLDSPRKREHHPVEINYDDDAQPPAVTFIQPDLIASSSEGTNDSWQRPIVRAVADKSERRQTNLRDRRFSGGATATELTINHPEQDVRTEQMEEERGVKLGLGDFIFYSVLVGKASSDGDWTVTISCYVSILVGLSVTLSLLAIFRKALPALPISIAFGMSSYFLSSSFVVPFAEQLTINQVFI